MFVKLLNEGKRDRPVQLGVIGDRSVGHVTRQVSEGFDGRQAAQAPVQAEWTNRVGCEYNHIYEYGYISACRKKTTTNNI